MPIPRFTASGVERPPATAADACLRAGAACVAGVTAEAIDSCGSSEVTNRDLPLNPPVNRGAMNGTASRR
jgi:hypothetical protein